MIVNKFGTPEFEAYAKRTYELAQKGYISPSTMNVGTSNDYLSACQASASYLIGTQSYAYGCEIDFSNARGIDVRMVPASAPYMDATSGQGAMIAISAVSKNPEKALEFLNLLNTDPYVMTLINYGVEGIHYNLNDAGEVEFTEARSAYSPWTNGVGNVTLLPPQKGQGADFQQRFAEFYAGSKKLPIYGFTFDSKPVETEIAQIANIKEAYALSLCTGAVDVDEKLPELLSKLEGAGIQKVVDEANAQLKAFLGE